MKTIKSIIYQGQAIKVDEISSINVKRGEGMEYLLRDEQGCYYFQREIHDVEADGTPRHLLPGYRCLLHRVNINAAILWQVDFACDPILRGEAADLIMEDRGYTDPNPCHLTPAKRESLTQVGDTARIPGRVTVELDDLASAMLRQVCREGSASQEPGEDPRDLVNAAVTFYLCDPRNDRHGEFDFDDGGDALERAKQDRLAKESEVAA